MYAPAVNSAGISLMPVSGKPKLLQPLPVRAEIFPRGGDNNGLLPQQGQVIGDVARGAAEPLR